jgi:hypothetical protein
VDICAWSLVLCAEYTHQEIRVQSIHQFRIGELGHRYFEKQGE